MDIGLEGLGSGLAGDDPGEIVRYEYLNQYITREMANCKSPPVTRSASAAFPFLGWDPSKGKLRTVRVINDELNLAVFRYYNGVGQGTELAIDCPTGKEPSCSQIPDIRRIDITLAVETAEMDPSTKSFKRMIYSTSALVRNHAF
jgi:hypothetical protein